MQKKTTLTCLRQFFGKLLPVFVLLTVFSISKLNAQYNNGNLGTGATSKSGVAAPAGTQWHEMQNDVGNTTETNVSIAFDCSPILGSSRCADDFTVPAGQIWNISKMTFYTVVLAPPPATSPITAVRVIIRDASPVGASTVLYGDLTTNRLASSSFANVYAIANSQVPAPGTVPNQNFKVWKVDANVTTTLTAGTYWIEYQIVGGAGQRVFSLMSQPVGARTAPGYNGLNTFNGGPWTPVVDAGNPATAPDVAVDFAWSVDYVNTGVCVNPTVPTITGNTNLCVGSSTTLTANGTLNSATSWKWYTGSCGGTPVGTGTSITVSPTVPTTYYVRGEGTCFTPGACGSITVNALPGPGASVLSQVSYPLPPVNLFTQNFDVAIPLPAGWAQQNLSNPVGPFNWRQGNYTFAGNSGGATSYIESTWSSTTTTGVGILSNWLFTPNVTMNNGDVFKFYTRTLDGTFPDRMEVRMSTNGASVNVGTNETTVGDYTNLLLTINPTLTNTGYPTAWTQFTVTISGLAGPTSGRLAFRHQVPNAGGGGVNSEIVAIDDVVYTTSGGILPPNTCTGSTANLKVDITGGLSPYTVVLNTVPPTTPITVNNYISGSSIAVTPAATTTYAITSVTSAAGCVGTGNSGTPTVVVSPTTFPALSITADPNTPLCAGDPTLLTVMQGAGIQTFNSSTPITINGSGPATPYPSNLTVSGLPVAGVTVQSVTLNGLNHTWASDLDIVLQSPSGQNVMLLSDAGGSADFINNTMIFNDAAAAIFAAPPAAGATATVKPTNTAGPDVFPAPGPASVPANPTLSTFTGDFNGVWKLFINDQAAGDQGTVTGGYSIRFVAPVAPLPAGYTYSWSPATGISNTTTNPVAASPMNTTTYTVLVTAPGGCQGTVSRTVVVNQLPAVTVHPDPVTICQNGSATFSVTATGAGPLTYQWQEQVAGVGPWNPLLNGAPYSGVTTSTLTISPAPTTVSGNKYRCVVSGICNPAATSNSALLTVNPLPNIPITPAGPLCGGVPGINGVLLTAGTAAPPVPGTVTVNSGPLTVAIPDNNPAGTTNVLAVSTLPANATITGMAVTLNMTHTWDGDMVFVLKTPNNNILNLDYMLNATGGAGATTGFTNTVFSSTSTTNINTGTNPYTGTFKADGRMAAVAPFGAAGPTGMLPNMADFATLISSLPLGPNGNYTLGMYDGGPADLGTLTSWSIKFDYTVPGTGSGAPLTYTWSPAAGLFTNATATAPYVAGTQTPTVYAAPTVNTVYTVTGTNTVTGCIGTSSITVNYTPPAPTVNPASVTMCQGSPAQLLTITSSLAPITATTTYSSGPISVVIPDASQGGAVSNLNVPLPANAVISNMRVNFNMNHTWAGDVIINLKAPNGNVLNLSKFIGATGVGPTTGFSNTTISSTGTVALSAGTNPWTGTFKADAINAPTAGAPFDFPTGYPSNATNFGGLYSVPNGTWTMAMADGFAGDVGTLTSWSLTFDYTYGPPAVGVWSVKDSIPLQFTGLFTDAAGTNAYTGTPSVTVYAKPTKSIIYQVTVANGSCTSPFRYVPVTVNDSVKIITNTPISVAVCTDKVTSIAVSATGTGLTYQWQVSTNNGNTWSNVTNGGVYSGATSNTLTITAPPVSMNANVYRVIIGGATACSSKTSNQTGLVVNPLPTVVIVANPYTKLFPGLNTTLASTSAPAAATNVWRRNGTVVGGNTATLPVSVDGLGDYTLTVTDVNGCVNTSNLVSITDSVSGRVFIYPNPNNGTFQVRYYSALNNVLPRGLNIYDAKGARIITDQYMNAAPYSRMDVDLRRFGKDVYWVEVVDRNGNRLAMGRVVVL